MNELTVTPTTPQITLQERNDDIDMHALFGTLSDHKWPILLGTALFFLIGVFYALVATPTYQANAVVQVEKKLPNVPGQAEPTQAPTPVIAQAVTEIPLLTSRHVLGQAVDALGLDIQVRPQRLPLIGDYLAKRFRPQRPGAVASPPPWFDLDRYGWGGEQLQVRQLEVPDELLDAPLQLVAGESGRYILFDSAGNPLVHGRVGETARGHGVTMQVKALAANPGTRFDVKRRSTLATINELRQNVDAIEQGRESGIILLTYKHTDPVLAKQVLEQIATSYVRQNVERNSAEAENSLRFVNEQLPKVRKELAKAQAALNAFQKREQAVDVSLQTKALLDQVVALSASTQQLRIQQAELDGRYTPEHPAYKALLQQIGQLQREKGGLIGQLREMPDVQRGLFQLTRDVEVTNQTYTQLLDQAQRLDIVRASAVGNARVIDSPAVNLADPVWPKKLPVIAGATALGAVLMIALVFFRQMLNRGVQDPAEIERLGLPVFASIMLSDQQRQYVSRQGRSRKKARQNLLALKAPSDLAMEALRGLRTSLHFTRLATRNNVLMIAGASPGVGKTFVSCNLAVTVAQAGQRVLLIDADMRRGTLHQVVGGRWEDGLSELISGQVPLDSAIRQVAGTDNLSFIPRGRVPPNPSELLMHPNFAALLQRLSSRYDLIVIDTPPVLAVTDAAVIGQHAGTSLLVVRSGQNQAREIALAKQRLEQNGVEIKGAIVNGIKKRSETRYIYGYYDQRPATG